MDMEPPKDPADWFSQSPHRVRMDWGWRGCIAAAARGDAVVIVDVIRFSTAVCAAASRGVTVYPASERDDIDAMCEQFGATQIDNGLAPATYDTIERGQRVVLRSPNGATCVRLASAAPIVMIGAIVNRSAVGNCIYELIHKTKLNVTVIACGERWTAPSDDGALRFAVEDQLGVGAVLSRIRGADLSAEAQVCAQAFLSTTDIVPWITQCGSGREQISKDDRASVVTAAMIDRYPVVPVLRDGCRLEAVADISEIISLAQTHAR